MRSTSDTDNPEQHDLSTQGPCVEGLGCNCGVEEKEKGWMYAVGAQDFGANEDLVRLLPPSVLYLRARIFGAKEGLARTTIGSDCCNPVCCLRVRAFLTRTKNSGVNED